MRPGRSSKLRALGIGAAIAVGASLGVLAPAAVAAAPANDNFAARASLGNALPVHESESNVGATREAGEEINGFSKGRSIWWEWEAPTSGWTTVSVCGSDMRSYVNVFEGTELGHLTSVIAGLGNSREGPQCWASQSTYTFMAIAGHHYEIGADGNAFYVPPPPPAEPVIPSGEGTIALSIEATPPPPNDAFATPIWLGEHFLEMPSPFEEPSEDRIYWEQTHSYNWGATKEAEEPDHAGDPGGASVWYAWTPPVSGEARISLEFGGPGLLALYEGSTLAGLTPVASSSEPTYPGITAPVTAGTEYRIAVDGSQTVNPAAPWQSFMGSFQLSLRLSAKVPLPSKGPEAKDPEPPCACPGVAAPQTSSPQPPPIQLGAHQINSTNAIATFRFSSPSAGVTFLCKLDGKAYGACSSPFKVKGLKPGKHVFRVLASLGGTTSTSPGVVHFTVRTPQRRHHQAD